MRTARPGGGEPGTDLTRPENAGYKRPSTPPQRPIRRRAPNRLFRDEVPAPSGLGGLTVDVTGGSCRSLLALADGEER
jgi:hypothetical protein